MFLVVKVVIVTNPYQEIIWKFGVYKESDFLHEWCKKRFERALSVDCVTDFSKALHCFNIKLLQFKPWSLGNGLAFVQNS